jgi:hypothetical protein
LDDLKHDLEWNVKTKKSFIERNLDFFKRSTTVVWNGTKWTYDKAMTPVGRTFDWWDNTVVSHVEDFAWLIAVEEFLSENATDGERTAGSIGLDLLPVSSNAKGLFELLMGYDPATGNDLGHGERVISGFSVALGPIADAFKHGGRGIRGIVNNSDKLKAGDKASDVGRSVNLASRDELLDSVSNQKLKNAIDQMYRPGATIGNGSLADAVRHELRTGELVGGKSHIQKANERVKNLENIIKKQDLDAIDLEIANELLKDLQNALNAK